MANDLTGQNIQDSYKRVLTVGDDGLMYDGTGSLYTPLSASHEITTELSSSYAETASMAFDFIVQGNVTASGNISASGDLFGTNLTIAGEITASGNISSSGKLYSTGLVMAPDSAITPSSNNESIYFRSKLEGTGTAAMEWMEIGDNVIDMRANGKQMITIDPAYIKFNAQNQDVYYQFNSPNQVILVMKKVGTQNLNVFRDHLSVGSGSSTYPTTDGLQNSDPDGTLKVWGSLNVADGLTTDGISGHITSSGNISASGELIGIINGGSY